MPKNPYWTNFICDICNKGIGIKYQNKSMAVVWARKEGWVIGKKTICPKCKGRR